MQGKRSQLDKQQLLEQMIEDEVAMGVPTNLTRYLVIFWALVGLYACRKDAKAYYKLLSQPDYRPQEELQPYFDPSSRWKYAWRVIM